MKGLIRNKAGGFSLIELVIVLIVLGILAAVAIPRYVDLRQTAADAAIQGNLAAVKSAFAILVAENKDYPTVTQLIDRVQSSSPGTFDSTNGGIQFTIGGNDYTIRLTSDSACTTAVAAAAEQVQCVKDVVNADGNVVNP